MKTIYEGSTVCSEGVITTRIDSDYSIFRITVQINNGKPNSVVIGCVEVAIMHALMMGNSSGSLIDYAINQAMRRMKEYQESEVSNG